MAIEKQPYVSYTLDEERSDDKGKPVQVWHNAEELAQLEKDKELFDVGTDSAMLKLFISTGRNLLYGQLGEKQIKYLVSRKRTRYTGK